MFDRLVIIRGGGDLGSGVALRLRRCGFPVVVLEASAPVAVRRTVAVAEAVYEGVACVEEMQGELVPSAALARSWARSGRVPVLVDPAAESLPVLGGYALVDAIMVKRNTGTVRGMAPVVIGLGSGFTAGEDVDAVVETKRGAHLGRVIWTGEAEPNTGVAGTIQGRSADRVLRAPADGRLEAVHAIGDLVEEGEELAAVDGKSISAPFGGLVRGLARPGLPVTAGMKVGDLDPRRDPRLCFVVSDKALAVAGGVLEALLMRMSNEHHG